MIIDNKESFEKRLDALIERILKETAEAMAKETSDSKETSDYSLDKKLGETFVKLSHYKNTNDNEYFLIKISGAKITNKNLKQVFSDLAAQDDYS